MMKKNVQWLTLLLRSIRPVGTTATFDRLEVRGAEENLPAMLHPHSH